MLLLTRDSGGDNFASPQLPLPPGYIQQHLEMLLVVTTGEGHVCY